MFVKKKKDVCKIQWNAEEKDPLVSYWNIVEGKSG